MFNAFKWNTFTSVLLISVLIYTPFSLSNRDHAPSSEESKDKSTKDSPSNSRKIKPSETYNQNNTINFYLYVHNDEKRLRNKVVLMQKDGSVPDDYWKPGGALKLITHGYSANYANTGLENLEDQGIHRIAEAYGKANVTLNIILMDWTVIGTRVDYQEAVQGTKMVGAAIAEFLLALNTANVFQKWSMIHLICFSLGSHVCGCAGYNVQELTKNEHKVGRISGVDPAALSFDTDGENLPKDVSGFLDSSDAAFVDIIHCNMANATHWTQAISPGSYGSIVRSGHVDFYPNGGLRQKDQCQLHSDIAAGCSHKVCVLFYALSITKHLLGCPCDSWAHFLADCDDCDEETGAFMGEPCKSIARGKYFLHVKDKMNGTQGVSDSQKDGDIRPHENFQALHDKLKWNPDSTQTKTTRKLNKTPQSTTTKPKTVNLNFKTP